VICQEEFTRERVEKGRESGDEMYAKVLSYSLKAAQHVESMNRGFREAYCDGELRLELRFRPINHEIDGNLREDSTIAYGFNGLIGAKNAAVWSGEFPDKRSVQCGKREHVVLVAVGELMEMYQGMTDLSLRTQMIRLELLDGPHSLCANSIESSFIQGLSKRGAVNADRVEVLKGGRVTVQPNEFVDDVVQGGAQIMDNISRYSRELERRMSQYLEAKDSISAIVCILLGNDRCARSSIYVKSGFRIESAEVFVGVAEFLDNASQGVMIHGALG